MSNLSRDRGALAIVLHTHMPYVEGFGTWPFGEEWLWEAFATSYLPLSDLLAAGAPLTLSLTPVLCDQLQAPGIHARCADFYDRVRRHTHHEDASGMRRGGHAQLAAELLRSWGDYERALQRLHELDGDLLSALAPYAQWTSAATHAVLPLLASEQLLALQVAGGVRSHRERFDAAAHEGTQPREGTRSPGGPRWQGGFWLPECAHAPWLEPTLLDAGVHATCVELTARLGLGSPAHLQPLRSDAGLVLVPIDRATISLVWSDAGYPASGGYRDYHHHTIHHHNPWANDGSAYDHQRALALAREHAADFVARTRARLQRDGAGLPGGGLVVCALDTELLGHWWYEGIAWLEHVVAECARQGLELVRLDDALARVQPAAVSAVPARPGAAAPVSGAATPGVAASGVVGRGGATPWRDAEDVTTWGMGGDLSTWSGPAVADIAFATRAMELATLRAGPRAGPAALRQLLALQASDWAFMVSRGLAVPYARERFEGHLHALKLALAEGPDADVGPLRDLAVNALAAGA
jgi:1,4-alpha-glucan branching enzyme